MSNQPPANSYSSLASRVVKVSYILLTSYTYLYVYKCTSYVVPLVWGCVCETFRWFMFINIYYKYANLTEHERNGTQFIHVDVHVHV